VETAFQESIWRKQTIKMGPQSVYFLFRLILIIVHLSAFSPGVTVFLLRLPFIFFSSIAFFFYLFLNYPDCRGITGKKKKKEERRREILIWKNEWIMNKQTRLLW
jgi:hypothetical protein